jgi:alpha,alpha-trehalase
VRDRGRAGAAAFGLGDAATGGGDCSLHAGEAAGPGGLRTTLVESGQQWDRPNGWAPLQWIAVAGLRRYAQDELAKEIAGRWIATVDATYARTGLLYEKYDVETAAIGGGGEYAPQIGFGWTNGVTGDLIDQYSS